MARKKLFLTEVHVFFNHCLSINTDCERKTTQVPLPTFLSAAYAYY